MTFTHAWGGTVNNTSASTSYSNSYVYTDGIPMPVGNQSLDGSYPIAIYAVSHGYASGQDVYSTIEYQGVVTAGPWGFPTSGGSFQHRLNHGAGSLIFGRNTAAGGQVVDARDGGTWSGSLVGSLEWATVPSMPTGISLGRSGRDVTVVISGSASDGGRAMQGYTVVRSENGGAYGNAQDASSGSTTFRGLKPGAMYQFAVYARNDFGNSAPLMSSFVKIPAGGKVRVAGAFRDAINKVRVSGTWRDAIIKVRAGGQWKDPQ